MKFNLLIISLILITSAGITFFMIRGEISHSYENLLNHGRTLAEMVAKNSEYGIYTENREALLPIVDTLSSVSPDLAYVSIFNQSKKELARKVFKPVLQVPSALSRENVGLEEFISEEFINPKDKEHYVNILVPVISDSSHDLTGVFSNKASIGKNNIIGYVQIILAQEAFRSQIKEFLFSTLLYTTVSVFLGILATLLFVRRITSPIKKLNFAAQEIARGKLGQPIEIVTGDEISGLARSFNQMIGNLRDYRVQVEERTTALEKSKKEWENTFDAISDWVCVVNLEGQILRTNLSGEEFTGKALREILGKTCCLLIHGTDNPHSGCPLKKSFHTKQREVLELDQPEKNRCLIITVDPIIDNHGTLAGAVHITRDITDRRRMEREKASLEDQLRQSQKMEAIGQLAGGVAHDFNNLLTIIRGNSELSLMDLKQDDPLREIFEDIQKASDKAAGLTRQLLAFSRRQVMEMKILNLNLLLNNLEKMLRRIIREDIELVTLLADDIGGIKADSGQIEQVVFNLAVNARDAMPEGGKLTIETANADLDESISFRHMEAKPGLYVMLSVSDTGVGMSPEVKDRIFEPFFTTKEIGKGTGLGLSTVYGIVKQSRGEMWVYSEVGKGTAFKIYFPRVKEEFVEESKEKFRPGESRNRYETILVTEDEEEVRKLVVSALEKRGYHVLEASNGNEAIDLCEKYKERIQLVVTDVVMPGMSGPQLAEILQSRYPGMKVLHMSGYTDDTIVQHGVLKKGVNYIQKPFTVVGLAKKVQEVLSQ